MNIKNKTIVITGGASGLGAACAEMIVAEGGNAVMLDVNEEKGKMMENKLGRNSLFSQADVTNPESVSVALGNAITRFGQINGLVNCAGIGPAARVLGREGIHDLGLFTKTIGINLTGSFNMIRMVAEVMQNNPPNEEGERGVIINTASVAAFEGQIGQAAYAASKGGIVSMTLPIAREFARIGIRVMTITPGIFHTPMMDNMSPEVQASLGAQVPFPSRLGQPSEYALLAKQIFENPMLNGSVIRLDGAIRMTPK
ncbi:MAG: 3-hydroxyacyl-CoA dehydrogenase [Saprospiraceae bacterium]|nr:3-hydroxyacyl-CoA dehydrogenase [Saprospiraceae bacterium]